MPQPFHQTRSDSQHPSLWATLTSGGLVLQLPESSENSRSKILGVAAAGFAFKKNLEVCALVPRELLENSGQFQVQKHETAHP